MINCIILCAGKSTRMKSDKIKVLHKLLDKPIIDYVVRAVKEAGVNDIYLVVGNQKELIKEHFKDKVFYAYQSQQLGTGNAVACATLAKTGASHTLIVMGDTPLLSQKTIKEMLNIHKKNQNSLTFLTTYLSDAKSYGRVVRDKVGIPLKIVEFSDATPVEKQIKEINTGVYVFDTKTLFKFLPYISNDNTKSEYRITDLVEILSANNHKVQALAQSESEQFLGINDRLELSIVESILQRRINAQHMNNGVTIYGSHTVFISDDTIIEKDVIIHPNNQILGNCKIGSGTEVHSNNTIKDSIIGKKCRIESSKIVDSVLNDNVKIGPFSHLRNNVVLGENVNIGNFVEVKKSKISKDTKSSHLTYIGDSEIGSNVNIGAGVITINYDGKTKHKTVIKDDAFIGSGVNLIAPITIGKNSMVAAGSTVNQNVEDGDMAIARSFQVNKSGYVQKYLCKINTDFVRNNNHHNLNTDNNNNR